jgi:hypothetical protein
LLIEEWFRAHEVHYQAVEGMPGWTQWRSLAERIAAALAQARAEGARRERAAIREDAEAMLSVVAPAPPGDVGWNDAMQYIREWAKARDRAALRAETLEDGPMECEKSHAGAVIVVGNTAVVVCMHCGKELWRLAKDYPPITPDDVRAALTAAVAPALRGKEREGAKDV